MNLVLLQGHFSLLADDKILHGLQPYVTHYTQDRASISHPLDLDTICSVQSSTATSADQNEAVFLIPQTPSCRECGHNTFLQVGLVTRCGACRRITTTARAPARPDSQEAAEPVTHSLPDVAIDDTSQSLPKNTHENDSIIDIPGLDRVLDSTNRSALISIEPIRIKIVQALVDFSSKNYATPTHRC